MVTPDELATTLAALEAALATRVRVIIDPDGKEIGRIYRGHFTAPRDSRIGEPRNEEHT